MNNDLAMAFLMTWACYIGIGLSVDAYKDRKPVLFSVLAFATILDFVFACWYLIDYFGYK